MEANSILENGSEGKTGIGNRGKKHIGNGGSKGPGVKKVSKTGRTFILNLGEILLVEFVNFWFKKKGKIGTI